jgi:hypothetical protein
MCTLESTFKRSGNLGLSAVENSYPNPSDDLELNASRNRLVGMSSMKVEEILRLNNNGLASIVAKIKMMKKKKNI